MKKSALSFGFWLILTVIAAVTNVNAATFTVTNTNDSGAGSLRQAILDANSSGVADTITFNIPGGGVHTIAPVTSLPFVSGSGTNSITIDATTQPGWAVGNLLIELSGENLSGTSANGLTLSPLTATTQSFVRGLIINRFDNAGILLQDSHNITIEGCYIGTDATGTLDLGNGDGINKGPIAAVGTQDITIGGSTAATRNLISGNGTAINIFGGSNYFIKGNYIGTDETGNAPLPNTVGIVIVAINSVIGGATTAERNVISGNLFSGIVLQSSANTVQNNYIGLGADGFTSVGNGGDGIKIGNSMNLVNRGNHLITQNVIANQRFNGITISPSFNNTAGNKISNNSIYRNSNSNGVFNGIDLDDDQATDNDAGDADTGTNNLQNFPVLISVVVGVSGTAIQGTLNSDPSTSYRIEFFSNDTDLREGKTFLGFQNVTTDASGNANINAISGTFTFSGQYVTATATRNVAPLDTSEFSDPIAVTLTSFTVTNTNDSGAGSLRQAIINANGNPDPNVIQFAITPLDGNVKTINLTSPLPTITEEVAINGLSQNGATCSDQKIELNGTSAGASGDGVTITADNVGIQGLVINRFLGDGILTSNNKGTFRCNKIGTNAAGTADLGNGASGILLQSAAHQNLIESNTLSGNTLSGLRVLLSNDNIVRDNIVGLSSDGLNALGNSSGGILIQGGTRNIVGGVNTNERNIVSANNLGGIFLVGTTNNQVKGNTIGTDINGGGTTFGNAGIGIFVSTSSNNNIIGGEETGAANIIARNADDGIAMDNGGTGNLFSRNSIHDNGALAIDLNNDGVTANDANDVDTGENNLQNFPVISSAEAFFGGLKVAGSINSTPNTALRLEIYANPTCDGTNGEGQNFLGTIDVTTNASGNTNFSQTLNSAGVSVGNAITAIVRRKTPPFDTSEFSVCRTATALTISTLTVTNNNDTGSGSLREAILTANLTPDPDQIVFNIPGGGVKTINLATALPTIQRPVIIDGLSQPGANCSAPLIELNGLNAGASQDGLHVSSVADIRGLIINRFNGDGIEFDGDDGNTVKCNWIGVDNTGLNSAGNGLQGLKFFTVSNNVIGGSNNDGNVISSNNTRNFNIFDGGIQIDRSSNNVIQGNIIGLDKNGLKGNITASQNYGISMLNADNNQIGGTTAASRNVVSNNDIGISLNNSDGNQFQGNYIGIEGNGSVTAGLNSLNGRGIYISGTSIDNVVGGTASGAGNVISNNSTAGIEVFGNSTSNQLIQGNFIGTDATGMFLVGINGSQQAGIAVNFAPNVTIGGRTAAERNIISGSTASGILIDNGTQPETSFNTVVEGNYIGLAVDGITPVGRQSTGGIRVLNGANGNRIGGNASGAGNVISGNVGTGVSISTKNNLVQGNFIGTDKTGTLAKPNSSGVSITTTNASNNLIGGTTAASRNIISGNAGGGISFTGSTTENFLFNNFVGVAINGTTALGNGNGISLITTSGNFIGNSTTTGNVISGNTTRGITFNDADNNFVQGNLIGTNATGTADLGNGDDGIEFAVLGFPGSSGNTIGGASANLRNVISGNNQAGINLDSTAQNTVIQNNLIGTGMNGATAIGNTGAGITIFLGSNNTIGSNTIAFNGQDGITLLHSVSNVGGTGNRISSNSIFSNNGLGIDLGNDGVTANDSGDGDLRANNLQNYPAITSIVPNIINATLNSTPNSTFTVEFFASPAADATGFGEGRTYLGSTNVTTNASGNVTFAFSIAAAPNIEGQFISATATNASGDTSEFSLAIQVLAPTAANVNIQGQVIAQGGRGISIARITLTDSTGNTRVAITNPFGYYRFLDVPSGENYVITVSHKSYEFNPSSFVINLTDEVSDMVLVGSRREAPDPQNVDDQPATNIKKPD